MKIWTAIGKHSETRRFEYLSACIREKGVPNEFRAWTLPDEEFSTLEALKEYDHVRLSYEISPLILRGIPVQSTWITLLGVVDGMVRAKNGWWPLCALYDSIGQLLVNRGRGIDPRGNVLVAGVGEVARTAITAFFRSGFRKFLVTHHDEKEAQKFIRDVQARFFGLHIEWITMDRIVLLPGDTSVLVNCTVSGAEKNLLTELSYLNFLKRPGYLFDLNREPEPSLLVIEARDAGVEVINGFEIGAHNDISWANWAFGVQLDAKTFAVMPDAPRTA